MSSGKTETGVAWLWDEIYIVDKSVEGHELSKCYVHNETSKTTYVKSILTKGAVQKFINPEANIWHTR
jgi:hypothetical protein